MGLCTCTSWRALARLVVVRLNVCEKVAGGTASSSVGVVGDDRVLRPSAPGQRGPTDGITALSRKLRAGPTALAAIERILVDLAEVREKARSLGCMGVNAICEMAREDAEVRALTETSTALLEATLTDAIEDGKAKGDVSPTVESRAAARFIAATLSGMKVQAKGGASTEVLRDVAAFAVDSLRPR